MFGCTECDIDFLRFLWFSFFTGHRDYSHYTLTVENAGKTKLDVTIKASDGWKATPGVLALSKGQSKSVSLITC